MRSFGNTKSKVTRAYAQSGQYHKVTRAYAQSGQYHTTMESVISNQVFFFFFFFFFGGWGTETRDRKFVDQKVSPCLCQPRA